MPVRYRVVERSQHYRSARVPLLRVPYDRAFRATSCGADPSARAGAVQTERD